MTIWGNLLNSIALTPLPLDPPTHHHSNPAGTCILLGVSPERQSGGGTLTSWGVFCLVLVTSYQGIALVRIS